MAFFRLRSHNRGAMYLTLTLLTFEPELCRGADWLRVLEPQTPHDVRDDELHRVVIGDKAPEREAVLTRARTFPSVTRNRLQLVLGRHQHARAANHFEPVQLHVVNHGMRSVLATLGDDARETTIASGSATTITGSGFVELRELEAS